MSAQTAMMTHVPELGLTGPLGSFDAYVERVSRVPVLSREDEQQLARRFREEDDLDAARQLVMSHLRFVVHIARGYNGYGLPLSDLVQEGNVGLMKAVKRFDPAVGVRLVSFAVHWIRAEIHEYVLRNWRLVRIATTKAQRKLFFNLRRLKRNLSWLSADETRAVAKDLGVPAIELHTGRYSHQWRAGADALAQLRDAADHAAAMGLAVHAGHGLTYRNVQPVAAIAAIEELNIGHSIVSRALFIGIGPAVHEMKELMAAGRQ